MNHKNFYLTLLGVIVLLSGCETYQAHVLTEQTVAKHLQTLSNEQLRIQAAQLKHPLLKPIEFNLTDGLSPDEAAILAVLNNPEARAARAALGVAQAQLLQAGLLPNPRLTYNFASPSGGLTQGKVFGFGLALDWEVTALLTQDNRVNAATAEQNAVDLQIAWKEWQVAQAAKLACYQLLMYQQQQTLLEDILQRLDSNRIRLQQAEDKGLVTAVDKVAADTAKNTAQSRLQTVQQQQNLQQQRLFRALGLKANETLKLQTSPALEQPIKPPSYEKLIEDLSKRRLDLLALQQGYAHQEEQVHIAVLRQFPSISIGITQSKNNSDYYTVGAGISLSIPLFDQNQGAIALAYATREKLFAEYSNRVFQTQADIAELLTTITALNQQIQTVQNALPDLIKLQQAYQQADETRQIDVLHYYQVWNNVTDKQLELLVLQQRLIEARVGLELATGIFDIGHL